MDVPEEYKRTVRDCPRCKTKQFVMHPCLEAREVIDPVVYREIKRNTNPLDKLTAGEYLRIMQGDEEYEAQVALTDLRFKVEREAYFNESLSYRVELEPLPTISDFRPLICGFAIQVEGPEENDWLQALNFLNEGDNLASTMGRKDETHQARLVSYGGEDGSLKYLWGVKRLDYIEGTGWVFSEWT